MRTLYHYKVDFRLTYKRPESSAITPNEGEGVTVNVFAEDEDQAADLALQKFQTTAFNHAGIESIEQRDARKA